jgi:peptide chain release factor 1
MEEFIKMVTPQTKHDERILAKLAELEVRFVELEGQMNDPKVANNASLITKIAKEHGKLKGMVDCYRSYRDLQRQWQEAAGLVAESGDSELCQMAQEEQDSLGRQLTSELDRAKEEMVMSDDAVIGSVIMEIRAGTGGEEAALFAGVLYRMYTRYAEKRGWKIEQISFSGTDMGGFREAIFGVKGKGVWQELEYEGGGHRVQRVPETEAQGRIHTSAATVAVLPEPEELDIQIKPDEVVEHVARSSGPGGQSVNKLNSAIKLEHLPTGITVSIQDERSQHKNRAKAWRILRGRVYDHFERIRRSQRDSARKDMIGSGDRSQRIRTYNFPQNRVTDHRINLSLYRLDKIVLGDMDDLVKALIDYDKQQRLENF